MMSVQVVKDILWRLEVGMIVFYRSSQERARVCRNQCASPSHVWNSLLLNCVLGNSLATSSVENGEFAFSLYFYKHFRLKDLR